MSVHVRMCMNSFVCVCVCVYKNVNGEVSPIMVCWRRQGSFDRENYCKIGFAKEARMGKKLKKYDISYNANIRKMLNQMFFKTDLSRGGASKQQENWHIN